MYVCMYVSKIRSYKTGRELVPETLTRSVPGRHSSEWLEVMDT
jgi:hypothetical protein